MLHQVLFLLPKKEEKKNNINNSSNNSTISKSENNRNKEYKIDYDCEVMQYAAIDFEEEEDGEEDWS